jgi:triosephosphate isomerase
MPWEHSALALDARAPIGDDEGFFQDKELWMERWIVGNWKMNGSREQVSTFAAELLKDLPASVRSGKVRVGVCPPFPYLAVLGERLSGSPVLLGAQNVHPKPSGAFTGEIAAPMLADCGVATCLVGHSERRQFFHETDALIREKLVALWQTPIVPILCIGETLGEREAARQQSVVQTQLDGALKGASIPPGRLVVAYEPVWAIGTGKTATPQQAQEMHAFIRKWLQGNAPGHEIPIQYGGSVTPENAGILLGQPDINGALIGGASLKAASFLAILQHAHS